MGKSDEWTSPTASDAYNSQSFADGTTEGIKQRKDDLIDEH
jgi:hypothetical protein